MTHQRFTIRVYGLLLDGDRVLVSHEVIDGRVFAKFPGGGLEFGEGPKDAVIREFKEETGLSVTVLSHFYTTDFYLPSAFDPGDQVLSIYYVVDAPDGKPEFEQGTPAEAEVLKAGQMLRWHSLADLDDGLLKLPADRVVARMLQTHSFR